MLKDNLIKLALKLAEKSYKKAEVPVGCVVFDEKGKIISYASNQMNEKKDPTAHAELIAIRKACRKLKKEKLTNLSIFTTLQPCTMCEAAIFLAGIKKIYFGAYSRDIEISKNIKYKAEKELVGYQYYGGIKEKECSVLIKRFFETIR